MDAPRSVAAARSALVDMTGQRIMVVGGGSGIGAAVARLAGEAGARVVVTLLPDVETAGDVPAVECDVTDAGSVDAAMAEVVAMLGGIDAVIVTAGIFDHRGLEETTPDDWHRVIAINLTGPYHVARAVLPHFRAAAAGSLVLFSSQIGIVGHKRATAYAASKGGVNALARTLAVEFATFGARVNAVAPGPIETPMTAVARGDAERAKNLVAAVPLNRFGTAEEVARAALYLAAPASAYVTGHVLVVDGGATAI